MPKTLEVASAASRKARTSKSASPTAEQIQMRAYEIYLERDGAPGNAFDDWIQAERELRAKPAKAKTTRPTNGRTSNGHATKAKTL
jgi:Protein of unknown function (DUF2934)